MVYSLTVLETAKLRRGRFDAGCPPLGDSQRERAKEIGQTSIVIRSK